MTFASKIMGLQEAAHPLQVSTNSNLILCHAIQVELGTMRSRTTMAVAV